VPVRFPFDTGIAATQGIPGHLNGGLNPVWPPFAAVDMDVDRRAEAALDPNAMLSMTSAWTNPNTFSSRGGKLLFYHGVSDPWFSAKDTIDYYERMTAARLRSTRLTCSALSSIGWRRERRPTP